MTFRATILRLEDLIYLSLSNRRGFHFTGNFDEIYYDITNYIQDLIGFRSEYSDPIFILTVFSNILLIFNRVLEVLVGDPGS